ncbi:MAG TPA: aminotransferase class V-fold PLP-dependent enzyme [Bacteroidia bacterium]|nr:aminotransferase class V-fold PLP-dependent enzyme [Bacteroidia bacterium]
MPQDFIYLDYNATTPVDEKVLQAMLPYFSAHFGNAASKTHALGWQAEAAIDKARKQVSSFINCEEGELVFTSGSTESCNIAIKGVFEKYKTKGNHIITVASEHKAVLDTCAALEKQGAVVTYLSVSPEGLIDLDELKNCLTDKTILVCVMLANNETGVIQPIEQIAEIVHAHKSILFCDATQAAGKMMLDVNELGVDLLCLSAHKFYGPKGIGALFVRRKNPRVVLQEQINGGGHEHGLRSGTLNVPAIVGFGKACEIAQNELWDNNTKLSALRAKIEHQLLDIEGVRINGSTRYRLYNTANICFSGINADSLISKVNHKLCLAAGSACTSALAQPSHVLKAMGLSEADCYSSIRFSLGKYNTEQEIETTISLIKEMVEKHFTV